jgi:hypothetical protein
MLKRLAMVGLLFILGNGAWSQVPRNGGQHEKDPQEQKKTADPPKPVVSIEAQSGANKQEQGPEKPSHYPWRELYAPANVPNWALVLVAGIAGWLAYMTLRAIKKQAEIMERQAIDAQVAGVEATKIAVATAQAAQKSADAALLNAQSVINAERGRLLFEVEKTLDGQFRGVAIFKIYAVKYGPAPVEILGFAPPSEAVAQFPNALPIPPQYETEMLPSMRFLARDGRLYVGDFSPSMPGFHGGDVIKLTESGVPLRAQSRIAYGEIRYMDGVSDEVRHSRYCLRFERFPFSNIGGSLVPAGPREYNECT